MLGVIGLLTAPCAATLLTAAVSGRLAATFGPSSLASLWASRSLSAAISVSISIFRLNSCSVTRLCCVE